jgi:hypothetical protein
LSFIIHSDWLIAQSRENRDGGIGKGSDCPSGPEWGRIRELVTDGNSIYHAVRARYEHRLSHGVNVTATYVHSHLIDDNEGSTNDTRAEDQDPRNRGRAERGNSYIDLHDQFIAGFDYSLPGSST